MSSESFNPFAGGEIERVVASTGPQREIIASSQMSDEANTAFNEAVTLNIQGAVDVELIQKSFDKLVERHDIFRVTFSRSGEEMCLQEDQKPKFIIVDLRAESEISQTAYLDELYQNISMSPMNLEEGPLLFGWMVRLTESSSELIIAAHHIVCDGWTFGLILNELAQIYSATGSDEGLNTAPSFLDYSERQNVEQVKNQDVDYWRAKFEQVPSAMDLPLDFIRPNQRTFNARRLDYVFEKVLTKDLKQASKTLKSSLVNIVLSGYFVLLYRLSRNDDVVVGLPIAGQAALNRLTLAGHMVQLLPIRAGLTDKLTFRELLVQVKAGVLDASEHANFTFGDLIKGMILDRSRVPLINTIFNIDQAMPALDFGECVANVRTLPRVAENFELFLNILPSDESLCLEATFSSQLFSEPTIKSWLGALEELLFAAINNPDLYISKLPLCNSLPLAASIGNQTEKLLPELDVIHAIENQAKLTPSSIAVSCGGNSLNYSELIREVNHLASLIVDEGVKEGDIIALCCERSLLLVTGALAIMKVGAAYLPLDPEFPNERLSYMLTDSQASLVLGDGHATRIFGSDSIVVLDVSVAEPKKGEVSTVPFLATRRAYVIYTSGSTGKPKGVEISSQSMFNFLSSMADKPGFREEDTLLAVTTLAFDISILELFLPLITGGKVVIAKQHDLKNGGALAAIIEKQHVNVMQATPSTWRLLLQSSWSRANSINSDFRALCGGEPLPQDLASQLIEVVSELWNMYGPTETTVWSTCKRLDDPAGGITIGRPIQNTKVYLLDKHDSFVPVGVPGELCIGGKGLAIGYLNRPALTIEKFFEHPELGRLYRTGDLAKWLPDGELLHLGRMDDQVKIRGYRIELGEIEQAIVNTGLVDTVAVILTDESEIDRKLVACCHSQQTGESNEAQIKTEIRKVLPSYMVPNHFAFLKDIPLTHSGKVDRKTLRAMSLEFASRGGAQTGGEPSSESERYLAELWQGLVDIDCVYVEDNFFDIGGHSLLAAQLLADVAKQRGVQLPFNALISSTLGQIAANFLDGEAGQTVEKKNKKVKQGWLSSIFKR
jgi:amino acid adenylation domain-containing protein